MQESVENWGQEYLRNIAGEIGEEYHLALRKDTDPSKELLDLVAQIVPYHMTHNSGKSYSPITWKIQPKNCALCRS